MLMSDLDRRASKARRHARVKILRIAAFCSGSLLFGASVQAQTIEANCSAQGSAASTQSLPYAQLATVGERLLASTDPNRGDSVLQLLEAAQPAGGVAAEPLAMARYCLVAGEAMRIARSGSGRQAKLLLVSAFRWAQRGANRELAARAAFSLGFAAAEESGVSAGPGVRGALDDASTDAAEVMRACAPTLEQASAAQADFFVAAAALDCAAATALSAKDYRVAAISNLRLARMNRVFAERDALVRQILLTDAEERLAASLSQAMQIPDPAWRAEVALRTIETLLEIKPADPAIDAALAQLQPTTAGRPGLEAYRLGMLARRAKVRGESAARRDLLARALVLEMQAERPLQLATWYLDLADAEPEQRGAHVEAAYRALESVRAFVPQFDPVTQESIFQLRTRAVFENAADYQLGPESRSADTIERAQAIIERYRQAELQNVFGSECVAAREPLRPADLAEGEMLLYPVLLNDRVELLYARSGSSRFERITSPERVGREEVTKLAQAMALEASQGGDRWREPARRLYDIIVKPVLAQAQGATTMIVVPDGPLRSIPFAALLDEQQRFLVERTRVAVAPALGYADPGQPVARDPRSVLALSLAREVALPAGTFPKLEGTTEEARAAAGPGGLFIEDFRKADLERGLASRRIDVLHMSTHASFNGRADRAFIVANGEAIRLGELRAMIADNQARGDLLNLLVLGACETAVGDDQASMGLAGAAVQAGAQSALASLWQVNDLGTAALMRAFYDNLRQGSSKAEALRTAQLSLIRSGPEYANPNIWSAFVLLGGWR
jgi:CHAT domain-containing protein